MPGNDDDYDDNESVYNDINLTAGSSKSVTSQRRSRSRSRSHETLVPSSHQEQHDAASTASTSPPASEPDLSSPPSNSDPLDTSDSDNDSDDSQDEDDDGDDDDDDDDDSVGHNTRLRIEPAAAPSPGTFAIPDLEWAPACEATCRPRWEAVRSAALGKHTAAHILGREKDKLEDEAAGLRRRVGELERENGELRAQLQARRRGQGLRQQVTWAEKLVKVLAGQSQHDYAFLYRLSCKEGNMSQEINHTHPHLQLRPAAGYEIMGGGIGSPPSTRHGNHRYNNSNDADNDNDDDCGIRRAQDGFGIRNLPPGLQLRILYHVLVFRDDVVHAISRLDPHAAPAEVPRNVSGAASFLHRFHVGREPVSLTHAARPGDVLAPLLACREWLVWGCYLFYGLNCFAFSSLGE
ncbi:hypothetical protein N3K66_004756 [Trichothecium roseum]|uniref:Uncharacterized protein n=1 Tax=Trichothecium roseum TaxID=47278 RepID=A0ACC0V264_9HYPO|nr:hypothetical protein N3K66_004756 [Trichothecium roseum]